MHLSRPDAGAGCARTTKNTEIGQGQHRKASVSTVYERCLRLAVESALEVA